MCVVPHRESKGLAWPLTGLEGHLANALDVTS